MQTWVSRLTSIKHLKHIVAEELCRQGILRAEQAKVLLLFRRRVYPELDPRPEGITTTQPCSEVPAWGCLPMMHPPATS